MNNSEDIIVSVCMITYNHEHFIAEAILGVLMQETNFKVELILAEDCSPDNSQKVIQEILDAYKGEVLIRYTRHTENKGMMPNFIWALNQCKSKYIALCEGDDYWTDPLKLQKQVDFLEENEQYSFVYTNVFVPKWQRDMFEYSSLDLFLNKYLRQQIKTNSPTICFRSKYFEESNFLSSVPLGDEYLVAMLLCSGMGRYIDITTANYRIHEMGAHSMKSSSLQTYQKIQTLYLIGRNLQVSKKVVRGVIKKSLKRLVYYTFDNKDLPKKSIFKIMLWTNPISIFDWKVFYNWMIKGCIKT